MRLQRWMDCTCAWMWILSPLVVMGGRGGRFDAATSIPFSWIDWMIYTVRRDEAGRGQGGGGGGMPKHPDMLRLPRRGEMPCPFLLHTAGPLFRPLATCFKLRAFCCNHRSEAGWGLGSYACVRQRCSGMQMTGEAAQPAEAREQEMSVFGDSMAIRVIKIFRLVRISRLLKLYRLFQ